MLIMGLTTPLPEMVTMGGDSPRAWTISRQQAPSTRHSKTIPNPRAQSIYGGPWQECCKTSWTGVVSVRAVRAVVRAVVKTVRAVRAVLLEVYSQSLTVRPVRPVQFLQRPVQRPVQPVLKIKPCLPYTPNDILHVK